MLPSSQVWSVKIENMEKKTTLRAALASVKSAPQQ